MGTHASKIAEWTHVFSRACSQFSAAKGESDERDHRQSLHFRRVLVKKAIRKARFLLPNRPIRRLARTS